MGDLEKWEWGLDLCAMCIKKKKKKPRNMQNKYAYMWGSRWAREGFKGYVVMRGGKDFVTLYLRIRVKGMQGY